MPIQNYLARARDQMSQNLKTLKTFRELRMMLEINPKLFNDPNMNVKICNELKNIYLSDIEPEIFVHIKSIVLLCFNENYTITYTGKLFLSSLANMLVSCGEKDVSYIDQFHINRFWSEYGIFFLDRKRVMVAYRDKTISKYYSNALDRAVVDLMKRFYNYIMINDPENDYTSKELFDDAHITEMPFISILANISNTQWFATLLKFGTQFKDKEIDKGRIKRLKILFKYISDFFMDNSDNGIRDMYTNDIFRLSYHTTKVNETLYDINRYFDKVFNKYGFEYSDQYARDILIIYRDLYCNLISYKSCIKKITDILARIILDIPDVDRKYLSLFVQHVGFHSVLYPEHQTLLEDINNQVNAFLKWFDPTTGDKSIEYTKCFVIESLGELNKKIYCTEDIVFPLTAICEAAKKDSVAIHKAQNKIYNAYKKYSDNEGKIDSTLTSFVKALRDMVMGDKRTEIIEGKKYTVIGILKKILGTVAIFSFSKIAGILFLVVKYYTDKKRTVSEKRKVLMELEEELMIINEKIEDARGNNNRKAKYALMRTKAQLENAMKRIKYGIEADDRSDTTVKSVLGRK